MKLLKFIEPEKNFLLVIFLFALFIRLIYVIPLSLQKLSPDAYDWMNIGWNIATGHGYGETWRPPGYATFLGIIFFLFGKSILLVRIINSILGSLTCIIIYFIGKKIFSENVGKISSILLCFYPYLICYTGDLLSETFLTFIYAISVLYVIKTSEKPSLKNIITTGILFGLSGLTKSVILPFFVFACGWLWWQTKKFRVGFFVGLFTLLTILPYTLRNYFHYNKNYVMPVSTPWYSFYCSTHDGAILMELRGELDTPRLDGIISEAVGVPKDWEYVSNLSLPERDKYCKRKAINWLKDNLDKYVWFLYKRFLHFWRLYPVMAYKWQKYIAMTTSGIYIPLCFIGIILSMKNFKKTLLLIGLFVIYTAVHLLFGVVLRYRVPIDPYMIIFAAYSINFVVRVLLKRTAECQ